MTYLQLTYLHLTTVVPAFFLGTFLMANRKGTGRHRVLGRAYMLLLTVTAVITLFMEAKAGPKLMGHFGFIHALSLLTLWAVPAAYFAARRHDRLRHRRLMIGTYVGAILIAGLLAFSPGRFLHDLFFA
jgi:uncharacterized membrane protein